MEGVTQVSSGLQRVVIFVDYSSLTLQKGEETRGYPASRTPVASRLSKVRGLPKEGKWLLSVLKRVLHLILAKRGEKRC